ncbi:predicted protein [Uncinocarpus reesii 1704]|uniref:Aminoglycoside phosphotransferase domain-containing protein n=1 Tax=Uncinocarpus reesii (strain UAMH 1704) TaxID=336963 RepID=C4JLU5_UNCRE|nr:uncharacterized protein UREG_03803 [Uncinocarpus reesii 1704]EEP78957.1 predicted protein [Uncinocarpus reesii 1704]
MAEGGFNKVFLLTMDDGSEVVARLPTPIAGPQHLTTASEVATMDFLRSVLDIPVPRVLGYCATVDNPIGAEYILMERLRGDQLGARWLSLPTPQLADLMSQIVEIERKLFSFRFPAYGSLYYQHDTPEKSRVNISTDKGNFCVGPVCKRQFWHDDRADLPLDRGPCIPLVPSKSEMQTPVLRHPDLSFPNIVLAPGSNKILSIIDWQDAAILPLFMQAGYPAFCEHELSQVQTLQKPKLPDNYAEMNEFDKLQADAKFQLEKANFFYTVATGAQNSLHLLALRQPGLGMRQYLISQAGYPWDADLVNFKAALVGIVKIWDSISSEPCPVSFSPADEEKALQDASEWRECAEILSTVQDSLGVDREGGTDPDNFEHACEMNQRWRLEMLKHAASHQRKICWQGWVFKGDQDNSLPPLLD